MKGMSMTKYLHSKGLRAAPVAQQMGVKRQALQAYGKDTMPTSRTLIKVAKAMSTLGVKVTPADIYLALTGDIDFD